MLDFQSSAVEFGKWYFPHVMVAAIIEGNSHFYFVLKVIEHRDAVHPTTQYNQSVFHFAAIISISTNAPFGRSLTAKAERAGKGSLKKDA